MKKIGEIEMRVGNIDYSGVVVRTDNLLIMGVQERGGILVDYSERINRELTEEDNIVSFVNHCINKIERRKFV